MATVPLPDVATFNALRDAIILLDQKPAAAVATEYTIRLTSNIVLAADLPVVNLPSGVSLRIIGDGHTIDGASLYRGLFVLSGAVTLSNVTIDHASAIGGAGGAGSPTAGGGGAGLGGGLFVAGPSLSGGNLITVGGDVTLDNVVFATVTAKGGAGGAIVSGTGYSGGGGGLGGAGGSATGTMGGGGASAKPRWAEAAPAPAATERFLARCRRAE